MMRGGWCRGDGGFGRCLDAENEELGDRMVSLSPSLRTFALKLIRAERIGEPGEASGSSSSESDASESYITARASALRLRETPPARLRRLKYEMAQLERDLQSSEAEPPAEREKRKPTGPSNAELLIQLAELQDRAEGCERGVKVPGGRAGDLVKEVVRGVQPRNEMPRHGQVVGESEKVMNAGAGYVADLDKRLHALETRIGTGTVDEVGLRLSYSMVPQLTGIKTTLPDSILTTLRKTTSLQSLLINPRTLDAASRKIKLLLADLQRASVAAGKQPMPTATHPDEEEKIQQLYALLPRLDPLLPLLPPLLTRLRGLAPLHANASAAQETISTIERDAARAERREEEVRGVLERVEKRLGENARMVEGNWASLEARLGDLQARLERLA